MTSPGFHRCKCYPLLAAARTRRELAALVTASRELGIATLLTLSGEEEETVAADGSTIEVLLLWKWLIGQFP